MEPTQNDEMSNANANDDINNGNLETNNTLESLELDANTPLTTAQKREKLRAMLAHIGTIKGATFLDMDRTFRTNYMELEAEIAKDEEAKTAMVNKLWESRGISTQCRDELLGIMGSNTPDMIGLNGLLSEFAGATAEEFQAVEKRTKILEEEISTLRKEREQREQEMLNSNAKRLRSNFNVSNATTATSSSTSNTSSNNNNTGYSQFSYTPISKGPLSYAPKKVNTFNNVAPHQQQQQQLSYREPVNVHARQQITNEKLTPITDVYRDGIEQPRKYVAPSAAVYAQYNNFSSLLKPSPNSATSFS